MTKTLITITGAMTLLTAASLWLLEDAHQQIGALELEVFEAAQQLNQAQQQNARLDRITQQQQEAQHREQQRLQQQINALRQAKGDACADSPVPSDIADLLRKAARG
jgi:septal ring factor EnvC (AmiA/AmiB activator)